MSNPYNRAKVIAFILFWCIEGILWLAMTRLWLFITLGVFAVVCAVISRLLTRESHRKPVWQLVLICVLFSLVWVLGGYIVFG